MSGKSEGKKIKSSALFFSHFGILPKLAKFFPDKIKYEREGHTELRPYNSC